MNPLALWYRYEKEPMVTKVVPKSQAVADYIGSLLEGTEHAIENGYALEHTAHFEAKVKPALEAKELPMMGVYINERRGNQAAQKTVT